MLKLDPASFISCLLSGALMIQVSGGGLCSFMHSLRPCVGSAFFSSITEDALPSQHWCLSKRGRLTVWVCSNAHYAGMLLVVLVVEAFVSLCIRSLGGTSCVCVLKKFLFTLFSLSLVVFIKRFFFPRYCQLTFVTGAFYSRKVIICSTLQYIRSIRQQQIKLQSKTSFCVQACLKKKEAQTFLIVFQEWFKDIHVWVLCIPGHIWKILVTNKFIEYLKKVHQKLGVTVCNFY